MSTKVIAHYIASWACYRDGNGSYQIENFRPDLCTHAIYAFADIDLPNASILMNEPNDYKKYQTLNNFKNQHPKLKTLLAIGGWNAGVAKFVNISQSSDSRKKFAKHSAEFLVKHGFNGMDLDWEFPNDRDGNAADVQNFVSLVVDIKAEFCKNNLILTSAFCASPSKIDQCYNISELAKHLNFMFIMAYDYAGLWDNKVGYNAPLTAISDTVDHLIKQGAPKSKIILGIPFYGRAFIANGSGHIDDSTQGGFQGNFTKEDGMLSYYEILEELKSGGWTQKYINTVSHVIMRKQMPNGTTRVVTFDNPTSISEKMRFIKKKGLGGAMVWSIDFDDFRGLHGSEYPLATAICDGLK